MRKAIFVLVCIIFLFTACSPQRNSGITPESPTQQVVTHTPISITSTPVVSTPTEVPLAAIDTPTSITVVQSSETPTPTTTPQSQLSSVTSTLSSADSKAIIIDHTSVALFEQIPDQYLKAAGNLRMMYSDRSVGQNINETLDCLTASSWDRSPAYCRNDYTDQNWNSRTFLLPDLNAGRVPSRILFDPDPTKYNRGNWNFEPKTGGWSELTQDFIENLAPAYVDKKDVISYQFSYLNVTDQDDIADPSKGFFADNPDKYDIYDLEAFLSRYPDKTFFFWTTSLARSIGTQVSTDFNNQMRQYVLEHNKILFDVADIESYTDQGTPCYDNRDGVQYCNQQGKCEDFPDDGQNFPAICQDYTTETEGGHLGSVSAGGIRLAKAFWVLMARIAGWDGKTTN